MKKIVFLFICIFININVFADEIKVEFSKCVDGDTAKFIYKDEVITARFLAIDTPESVHPTIGEEPFGKDASNFTCDTLKKADEIVLEFDSNSDKTDKYDRYLVWVFVDGKLLQKELISKGYAEVAYLYDDYKYTEELEKAQEKTKKKKIGIWSLEEEATESKVEGNESSINNIYDDKYSNIVFIAVGVAIILIFIFSEKGRKNIIKYCKQTIKKELKK